MTFIKAEMSSFVSSWLAQEKLFLIAAVLKAQNYFIKFGITLYVVMTAFNLC